MCVEILINEYDSFVTIVIFLYFRFRLEKYCHPPPFLHIFITTQRRLMKWSLCKIALVSRILLKIIGILPRTKNQITFY